MGVAEQAAGWLSSLSLAELRSAHMNAFSSLLRLFVVIALLAAIVVAEFDMLEPEVELFEPYLKKGGPQGPLRFGKRRGPSGPLRFGKRSYPSLYVLQ